MTQMRTGLLVLMIAGVSACGSSLGSGGGKGGAGGPTTGSGGATGGSAAGTAGAGAITGTGGAGATAGISGTGTGGGGGDIACAPGIPTTTQLRRLQNRQYDNVVRDLLGVTTVSVGTDVKAPSEFLFPDSDGPMATDAWRLYKDVGKAIAKAVMANPAQKAKFITCDPAVSGCLTATIKSFGRKAFRRPVTDAEVTRFAGIGEPPSIGTPDDVAEATLVAFLVSPSFLMVPELSKTPAGQGFQLSSHEVAARLSLMLWGSVADDVLNTAADANQLQTKDQILTQAQRMLAMRDKAAPQVTAFHRYWARMDDASSHWWRTDHDVAKYPLYSPAARTTLAAELDSFFAEIAYTNGSYKDLLLSGVGFVNKDNAPIYGLTGAGTTLAKVQLDSMQRPGFLTRAGFLSSYSHYDSTAPILRGAFITRYLLGIDPGPPIPSAALVPPPPGNYTTNRQRTEALTSQQASCAACHTGILNPPGFVLENYDAIGKWQTVDPLGGPIDATAMVNFGDGNIKRITNAQELMQEIARTPRSQLQYAQSLVAYGYGRQPNAQDRCVAEQLAGKLASDGYPILTLLSDLTQADSFRQRVRAP